MLCFLDATGEALAGILRAGNSNSGSNTAADHITVLDAALAQIPDQYRHGNDILVRCDSAGASHAFLRHLRSLREQGVRRCRLLHVAARIVRTARHTVLRVTENWPWAQDLTAAYARLAALPRPLG